MIHHVTKCVVKCIGLRECVCVCACLFYCQSWDDNNLMSGITTKTHTHTHTYRLNDERSKCMFILWLLLLRNSCWWMTNQLMIRAREAERKKERGREGRRKQRKEGEDGAKKGQEGQGEWDRLRLTYWSDKSDRHQQQTLTLFNRRWEPSTWNMVSCNHNTY